MLTAQMASGTRVRPTPAVIHEIRLLAPFAAAALLFIGAAWLAAGATGLASMFRLSLYSFKFNFLAAAGGIVFLAASFGHMALIEREPRPLRRIRRALTDKWLTARTVAGVGLPVLLLPLFMSAFSSFKGMIAHLAPFRLDPFLASFDRLLHFGVDPWRITHALLPGPEAALVINVAYNYWMYAFLLFLAAHSFNLTQRTHRAQYLLAFVLCWAVIGSAFALLLSSAGPVYYGRVTGLDDIFAPLMDRLRAYDAHFLADGGYWHIWALDTQEWLWDLHVSAKTDAGVGISAMPSMHVSIATLMALSAWRMDHRVGWVMTAYAAVILIGSVHLGWHYAVDGYVAIALTIGLWRLAGKIIAAASRHPGEGQGP